MCNCFNDVWSSFFRKSIKNRQIVWSSWSAIQSPEIGFVLGHSKSFDILIQHYSTSKRKKSEGDQIISTDPFPSARVHISYFLQLDRRTWRLPFWSCDQLPLCGELCHLQLISCDSCLHSVAWLNCKLIELYIELVNRVEEMAGSSGR